jgi:ketosteroid isomerase-like protein
MKGPHLMDTTDRVAAELAVRNLYARYCFALDGNDIDGLGDCFTAEGVFALSDRGDFAGRDTIKELIRKTVENRPRHHALNVEVVDVAPGEARSRAYFLLLDQTTGAAAAYGQYEDRSVQDEDGTWRFARRDVDFLWRASEYADRAAGAHR